MKGRNQSDLKTETENRLSFRASASEELDHIFSSGQSFTPDPEMKALPVNSVMILEDIRNGAPESLSDLHHPFLHTNHAIPLTWPMLTFSYIPSRRAFRDAAVS